MSSVATVKDPVSELLASPPYGMSYAEKERLLLPLLADRVRHSCNVLPRFERYVRRMGFTSGPYSSYLELPYLPVSAFKDFELCCVPKEQVTRVLRSSGTTKSVPSQVFLDRATAFRQSKALATTLADVLGSRKRPYLVLDCSATNATGASLTARGAAVRGFLPFASSTTFALVETPTGLEVDVDAVARFFAENENAPVFASGFTYIVWSEVVQKLQARGIRFHHPDMVLFHSGGWKRLQELSVTKSVFAEQVSQLFGCSAGAVRDFYGMVEQVGIIFIDCEAGNKHSPVFGEVIIRALNTFAHARVGERGLIEVVSLLPTSYPGHAVLTEDMGTPLGYDDCPCGRPGLYFQFVARVSKSEVRGCGDTFAATRELSERVKTAPTAPRTKDAVKITSFRPDDEITDIRNAREYLTRDWEPWARTATDTIVAVLSAASATIASPACASIEGIAFLSSWLRANSLKKIITTDFGTEYSRALDAWVQVGSTNLRAVPRGVAAQWIAGNIPTLAVFSWALATIAKNASIIRVPAASWETTNALFTAIASATANVSGNVYTGRELLSRTVLVQFDSDDTSTQHAMSRAADVRVVWGGAEAVHAISGYPRMDHCEDVIFGPKFSVAVVDRMTVQDESALTYAVRAVVRDAIAFDQAACSSPQLMFAEADASELVKIGDALKREFERQLTRATMTIDEASAAKVLSTRALYALSDELDIRVPADLSFSVFTESGAKLRDAIQYRTLFLIGVNDLNEVVPHLSPKIQTIGAACADEQRFNIFAHRAAVRGVSRIVKLGTMNMYEVPWDGIMPLGRLVRWCRC